MAIFLSFSKTGTEAWQQKAMEVKKARAAFESVRKEINAVRQSAQSSGNFLTRLFKRFGDSALSVFKGFSLSTLVTGLFNKLRDYTGDLLRLSDAMSDVRKTTGLTQKEVSGLYDAFDRLDTRTSKMDLLKIAETGGRLGISDPKELQAFAEAVDKANIALGDSFSGGLEQITTQLGKIRNLFADTQAMPYAEAIHEVGSALNELAASGTSSEANIAEFALRIGRLPEALRPGTAQVLGLGAAFEESGVDARIASSGYARFILTASQQIGKFARSMHMGTEAAKNLLNKHPEEFFLRFAKGMKGLPATQTAKVLQSLKLNTLEITGAIGAATQNTDRFRTAMDKAQQAMAKGTSLQEEFNKKNNNTAALWDKVIKTISDYFKDDILTPAFQNAVTLLGLLTGVTAEASEGVKRFRDRLVFLSKILAVAAASLLSYKTALLLVNTFTKRGTQATILNTLAQKVNTSAKKAARGITLLFAAAKQLLTGNITRATAAMRLFNITTRLNPLGLLITVVTAAVTAWQLFSAHTKKASEALNAEQKAVKAVGEAHKQLAEKAGEAVGAMQAKIEPLIDILKDENASLEMRQLAYEKLIKLAPNFKGTVDKEYRATKKLSEVYLQLCNNIEAAARAKGMQEIISKQTQAAATAKFKAFEALQAKEAEDKKYAANRKENAKPLKAKKKETENWRDNAKYGVEMRGRFFSYSSKEASKELLEDSTEAADAYQKAEQKAKEESEKLDSLLSWRKQEIDKLIEKQNQLNDDLKKLKEGTDEYKKKQEELKKNQLQINAMTGISSLEEPTKPNDTAGGEDASQRAADDSKSAKAAKEKANQELLKAVQAFEDQKFSLQEDSFKKEIEAVKRQTRRKKAALVQENQKLQSEIEELEKKSAAAKDDKAKDDYKTAAADKLALIQTNQAMMINYEQIQSFKIKQIQEKGANEALKQQEQAWRRAEDGRKRAALNEINQITTLAQAKATLKEKLGEKISKQELEQIKSLTAAKQRLTELAEEQALIREKEHLDDKIQLMEEALKTLKGKAAEKLKNELNQLKNRLTQLKTTLQGNKDKKTEDDDSTTDGLSEEERSVDVLGFTAGQWEDTFKNIDTLKGGIAAAAMTFKALANAGRQYADLQRSLGERELRNFKQNQDKQKKILLDRLDRGLISQAQYTQALKKMETDLAKKKAEMAYKEAKTNKITRIFDSIGNTAVAVTKALPKIPLAIAVGAMGALQTALIAAQPLPPKTGYEAGGPTRSLGFRDETGKEVAGWVHANEYVIPEWLMQEPAVADVAGWLEAKRTKRLPGYADGGTAGNPPPSTVEPSPDPKPFEDPKLQQLLYGAMLRLNENLERLESEGLPAYLVADEQAGKQMKEAVKKYTRLENQSKV